jgi:integrase
VAGYIEDRWVNKTIIDPKTKKKKHTDRYGKGDRYKVDGIPGVQGKTFKSLKDAEIWKAKAQTKAGEGTWVDPRNGDMLLREYVEAVWWPSLRVPPGSKESMRTRVFRHILPHVGALPLNRVGSEEIKAWVVRAEKDIDVSTIRTTWQHFSQIMQAATKAKRIAVNPFRDPDLKAPTVTDSKAHAWPREVVAAVRSELHPRYRILVDEAVGAGVRQGEAFGLTLDDIDGDELKVVRQVLKIGGKLAFGPPKGNKERRAPCPAELAEAMRAYAEEFPAVAVTLPWVDPNKPNLPWADRPKKTFKLLVTTTHLDCAGGGAVNRSTFDEHQWKWALVRAGVIPEPTVTYVQANGKKPWRRVEWDMPREDGFHVLRHTMASIVLSEGETIQQLAAWLGHGDPGFTYRVYAHFLPKSGKNAIKALGGWVGEPAEVAPGAGPADLADALAQILASESDLEGLRRGLAALLSPEP